MNLARVIFETIDKVFEKPQNPTEMEQELQDVNCISDIVYSKKYPDMALDVFVSSEVTDKLPVIFEIHGGGFTAGDKKYRRCLCRYYAKNTNAAVINVNYGVGEENACPLPMQHLTAAVNWVAANAEKYNLDLSKFVVTGDSAGAFYACFLAVLQNSPSQQKLFKCKPKASFTAAILNCGVYDFRLALQKKALLNKAICKELMGTDIETAKKSPYFKGLTLTDWITDKFPPTMLIYAKNDIFCNGQGEALLTKLDEFDVPTKCICAKSFFDNHTYSLTWRTAMAKQTNEQIIAYLKDHFAN